MMKVLAVLILFFSLFLFSCDGVDGDLIEKGPSIDYVGLCSEAQWVYRVEQDLGFGEDTWVKTIDVVYTLSQNEDTTFYIEVKREGVLEESIMFKEVNDSYFFWGDFDYEEEEIVEYPIDDPLLLLERPLDERVTLFNREREPMELEVMGREKIDVQAGYYLAYHLRGEDTYVIGRTVLEYWFVPHLGIIKMVEEYQEETEEGWIALETTEMELTSFGLDNENDRE